MSRSAKNKASTEVLDRNDVLQAVVIADSFDVRFAPLTTKKPRTLLPLLNVPLLEYTLSFLTNSGIEEIFIYCCHIAEDIKAYVSAFTKTKGLPCELTCIVSENVISLGDCLRDLDAKDLISSDFVLVHGDVVSNISLLPIIKAHKARREKDKSCAMTILNTKAFPGHRSRCKESECTVAVNAISNMVLNYQNVSARKRLQFPLHIFQDYGEVELHHDLLDCQISICSPTVCQLFTDNFDYQTREDFIRGTLTAGEVHGNTIYMYLIEDEYAARVSNLSMYDSVSKDLLNRWAFPVVPDLFSFSEDSLPFCYGRRSIYLHQHGIKLARGCCIEDCVMIGKGTTVGKDSVISHSIIGSNCTIENNVVIHNSYIWNGITIKQNCRISKAILADEVTVLDGVVIHPGCVISYGVRLGPNISLPCGSKLVSSYSEAQTTDGFNDDDIKSSLDSPDPEVVGSDGIGYLLPSQPVINSDSEEEKFVKDTWGMDVLSIDDSDDSSILSLEDEDDVLPPSPPADDTKLFYNEVLDSLQRGVDENVNCENLILEVNSSKYAYNVTMKELNIFVIKAILELPHLRTTSCLQPTQLFSALKSLLSKLKLLLMNYIKSAESQLDCLQALEESCLQWENLLCVLAKVIHLLYDLDVIEEQVIHKWFAACKPQSVKSHAEPFIKWLQVAEEESSDSD